MIIYDSTDTPIINTEVDDSSYRYLKIMESDEVVLEFSLTEHVELPVGAYITFQNARYELMKEENVKINHNRDYEYKVTFCGPLERAKYYIIHNTVDHRLKFDLTATPADHLAMIVANMNERDGAGVWSVGTCISKSEITISYNHTYCADGLSQLADECDTEFEITRLTATTFAVSLRKVEYYKDTPLALGYGKNQGFEPGVERVSSSAALEKIWIEGSSENITLKEYGASILHLPQNKSFSFDGDHFDGESGYVSAKGIAMATDTDGYSVKLASAGSNATEGSLNLEHIYPKRVGTVSELRFEYKDWYYTYAELIAAFPSLTDDDWDSVQVDIIDSGIPAALDYSECLISNDSPLVVTFQSGPLAGREFDATFQKAAKTQTRTIEQGGQTVTQTVTRPANRFELVKADHDGVNMPTRNYLPAATNTYIVTNCVMPEAYIHDDTTFSGAEWEALREAAKYLYENKDKKRSYKGTIDGLFAKRDWVNIAARLKLGAYISFSHTQVQATPISVRIVALKQYINKPHKPEIEISNDIVSVGKSTAINEVENRDAHAEALTAATRRFAKRGFRDAKETAQMLIDAALDGFTEAINPIAVQTMQMIAGDERLQFSFVRSLTDMTKVDCPISYSPSTKKVTSSQCYIQHHTLGINGITSSGARTYSDYKRWTIASYESAVLDDATKKYYIYAKVSSAGTTGEIRLYENARAIDADAGYYNLLVGVLNSENDGDRSFATMYGFTEILPGQVLTDRVVSSDGNSYFDLLNKAFKLGSKLSFNLDGGGDLVLNGAFVQTGSGTIETIGAWCGQYDNSRTYKLGDEVYAVVDGKTSSYRYINSVSDNGHPVTDSNYWVVFAAGVKGDKGDDGDDGTSINWRGSFAVAPPNPEDGWAYYNVLDKKSYVFEKKPLFRMVGSSLRFTEGEVSRLSQSGVWHVLAQDGNDGDDGVGISSTSIMYNTSASGTTAPVSGWSSTVPSCPAGYYLWTRTILTYSDGTTDTSYSVARQGVNGSDGNDAPAAPYQGEYDNSKTYYGNNVRCDIVYYSTTSRYYIAKATVGGTFSGKVPTNTAYWNDFGSSFDSIATGFLFAEQATLENAVVRKLRTAESGQRIIAEGNAISMYDSSGLKMKICGEDLSSAPSSTTTTISTGSVVSQSKIDTEVINSFQISGRKAVATINVLSSVSQISLPSISLLLGMSSYGVMEGNATSGFSMWYEVDGERVGSTIGNSCIISTSSASQSKTVTLSGTTLTLSAGSHTIQIGYSITGGGSSNFGTSTDATTLSISISTGGTINITYPLQKTEIASNGFRVMFGSDYMFQCSKSSSDSSIEFVIRAGNYGLKVNSSGVYKMTNGSTWVSL